MRSNNTDYQDLTPERSSIIDVFENFFGTTISKINDKHIGKLSNNQTTELVELLDMFLEATTNEEFAEDSNTLDGFASPIIIPFDESEPKTTRRAKQVALLHSEVIFPLQEISLDYSRYGRMHLESLRRWSERNEKLLKSHVFTLSQVPNPLDYFDPLQISELGDWLIENLLKPENKAELEKLIPNWKAEDKADLQSNLSSITHSTLQDAYGSVFFGNNLSFTDKTTGYFYNFCTKNVANSLPNDIPALFSDSALLHSLELPAIDDIKDEDFVGIRLESEDFEDLRDTLKRSMKKTADKIEKGEDLNQSFKNSLDEVRWKAEILRKDLSDKSLSKYLKTTTQNVAVGSFVSTAAEQFPVRSEVRWILLL